MRKIICLTGEARSGKDTTGLFLVEKYNFKRFAFADGVKKTAAELEMPVSIKGLPDTSYGDVLDTIGYELAKPVSNIRDVTIKVGEGLRNCISADIWANMVMEEMRHHPNDNIVITDMRQQNEYDLLKWHFGVELWKICKSQDETSPLDEVVDKCIYNNGTIKNLHDKIDLMMKEDN